MRLLNKHLILTCRGPFFFGLSVITFLLMIDTLFNYVDLFVTKGVAFPIATEVLLLSLPHTFALSIPMSVLVGVLMGVGQLAADNEITAMKASGISLWSVLRPLLATAAVITVAMTAYNHFVFPDMNHTLANLLRDISQKRPMLEIQPQQFNDLNDKLTIFVATKDDKTGRIEDVTIIEKEDPGDISPRMTFAEWGTVINDHEDNALILNLHNGETHEQQDAEDPAKYQVIRFSQLTRTIGNAEQDMQKTDRKAKGDREMDLGELLQAADKERVRQADIHSRISEFTGSFLNWEWNLLQPKKRDLVLGGRISLEPDRRELAMAERFRETRTKVQRTAEQCSFQERVLDSYVVKANRYLVEFHKKFAIPFACMVFTLLGVPMAVSSSRSGRGVSVSLAIGVFLVYYLFLVGGEKMADRGRLDPFLAMWSANFFLLAVGIPVFMRTVKESSILSVTHKPRVKPSATVSDRGSTA